MSDNLSVQDVNTILRNDGATRDDTIEAANETSDDEAPMMNEDDMFQPKPENKIDKITNTQRKTKKGEQRIQLHFRGHVYILERIR